jgi:hypothetical protein
MPGKRFQRSIKRKKTYHALRRKGMSKTRAAKISNAQARKGRRKKGRKRGRRKKKR